MDLLLGVLEANSPVHKAGTKGSEGAAYYPVMITFLGQLADEVFIGKGGNVTYVFSSNFGNDMIKDFKVSSSEVQFDGNMAHVAHVGSYVVISVDANNSMSLHDTLLAQLTANNFHLA